MLATQSSRCLFGIDVESEALVIVRIRSLQISAFCGEKQSKTRKLPRKPRLSFDVNSASRSLRETKKAHHLGQRYGIVRPRNLLRSATLAADGIPFEVTCRLSRPQCRREAGPALTTPGQARPSCSSSSSAATTSSSGRRLGQELQELAPAFISRRTGRVFLRYLDGQRRSLLGERHAPWTREPSRASTAMTARTRCMLAHRPPGQRAHRDRSDQPSGDGTHALAAYGGSPRRGPARGRAGGA